MLNKIICPKCGREYLPCEIFLPNHFLGRAENIEKDENGLIESYSGIKQDLSEEYICDSCNTPFNVTAHIDYDVKINNDKSFDEEYSTTIFPDRIMLKEE